MAAESQLAPVTSKAIRMNDQSSMPRHQLTISKGTGTNTPKDYVLKAEENYEEEKKERTKLGEEGKNAYEKLRKPRGKIEVPGRKLFVAYCL